MTLHFTCQNPYNFTTRRVILKVCKYLEDRLGGKGCRDGIQKVTKNLKVLQVYETTSLKGMGKMLLTYVTVEMKGVCKTKGKSNCTQNL